MDLESGCLSRDGTGLETTGAIRTDQIKTLDFRASKLSCKETVPLEVLDDVVEKIKAVLGGM